MLRQGQLAVHGLAILLGRNEAGISNRGKTFLLHAVWMVPCDKLMTEDKELPGLILVQFCSHSAGDGDNIGAEWVTTPPRLK